MAHRYASSGHNQLTHHKSPKLDNKSKGKGLSREAAYADGSERFQAAGTDGRVQDLDTGEGRQIDNPSKISQTIIQIGEPTSTIENITRFQWWGANSDSLDYFSPSSRVGSQPSVLSSRSPPIGSMDSVSTESTTNQSIFDEYQSAPDPETPPPERAFRAPLPTPLFPQGPSTVRLPCEFSHALGCSESFSANKSALWVYHVLEHLEWIYPAHCVCWFCDDVVFSAHDHGGDRHANFNSRMEHIRDHIVEQGLDARNPRIDWFLVDHLVRRGLIKKCMIPSGNEGPTVDGEVSHDYVPPHQLRSRELNMRVYHDNEKEERRRRRYMALREPRGDRHGPLETRTRPSKPERQRSKIGDRIKETPEFKPEKPSPAQDRVDSSDYFNETRPGSIVDTGRTSDSQAFGYFTALQTATSNCYSRAKARAFGAYWSTSSLFWSPIPPGFDRIKWDCASVAASLEVFSGLLTADTEVR